jgi:Spy/CpxP family protein refolding chaperone
MSKSTLRREKNKAGESRYFGAAVSAAPSFFPIPPSIRHIFVTFLFAHHCLLCFHILAWTVSISPCFGTLRFLMVKARLVLGLGVVILAIAAGGFSLGDDKKPDDKEPKAKGQLPPQWKKLGLDEAQVQKIYKIETSYRTKIDDLKQQIEDLRAAEKVEMEKVLTDAQKARLKELKLGEKDDPKDKPEDKKPAKDEKPKDKATDK